jgi:SRSO17 transposase
LAERTAVRHYLIGLLLPRERNKTLTELAALVPGPIRQRLHHFLHDAPWDSRASTGSFAITAETSSPPRR